MVQGYCTPPRLSPVGILHPFADPFSRWTMALFSVSFPIAGLVMPAILLVIGILLL